MERGFCQSIHMEAFCFPTSEFLHQLVGGRRERIPLTFGTIASTIYSDRVIFGKETIEIRHESNERFAGMFGWKEYPSKNPTRDDRWFTHSTV